MFRNIFAAALMAVSMQAIHLQSDTDAGVDMVWTPMYDRLSIP